MKQVAYYDEDAQARTWTCDCGWSGPFSAMPVEYESDFEVLCCPTCDKHLGYLNFPTFSETRRAAAAGNARAIAALPGVERTEARRTRAASLELRKAAQLPDLALAGPTRFVWDQVEDGGEQWTEIRLAGSGELAWRQLAYYEGWEVFLRARDVLAERYGDGFAALVATGRSLLYLFGDSISARLQHEPEHATAEDAPWVG